LDFAGNYRNEYWGTTGLDPAPSPLFAVTAGQQRAVGTNRVAGKDCDPAVLQPGANLAGTDLRTKFLAGCVLNNANLSGALLNDTNLVGADLSGVTFSGANFTNATITGATLTNATRLAAATGVLSPATDGGGE